MRSAFLGADRRTGTSSTAALQAGFRMNFKTSDEIDCRGAVGVGLRRRRDGLYSGVMKSANRNQPAPVAAGPIDDRNEAARRAILAATVDCYVEYGWNGANISGIAWRATSPMSSWRGCRSTGSALGPSPARRS